MGPLPGARPSLCTSCPVLLIASGHLDPVPMCLVCVFILSSSRCFTSKFRSCVMCTLPSVSPEPLLSHRDVPQELPRKTEPGHLSIRALGTSNLLPHPCSVSVPGSASPVTCPSGTLELSTPLIAAHQLYNYVADHASSYHMKPLRMARPGGPEHNEYALVSAWHR